VRHGAGAATLEAGFGALIEGLALLASLALLAMVAIICADVLTRNVAVPGLPRGIPWSNEISELLLYAITLLAAPWLLREGRHIRVDIVLRALPKRAAYACEWLADALGLASCLWLVWYGSSAAWKSLQSDALSIKTLVMPEWWFLAPLPICFALLAIEFVFRMRRLARAEVGPRDDAVSAA
jgi:TRAP-type C4-dicarboxylate transport system permease small subunit